MIHSYQEFIMSINESTDDKIVTDISKCIDEITGEWPRPVDDLYKFIENNTTTAIVTLRYTEEIKDGRSSRFNKNAPLKLKNKIIGNIMKLLINDISFSSESEQESESDHRYVDYIYKMTIVKK